MNFGWFQSLLLGIINGLTEILPVSVQAHNKLLLKFMGRGELPALMNLCIHLGVLAAILLSCQPQILKMVRAKKMSRIPKRKRKRPLDTKSLMDLKLLTTMILPVVLMLFVYRKAEQLGSNMIVMATLLFVNGLLLYIPQFLPSSNKDCRNLSRVEGLLMGLGGAGFAIPGLSGTGIALSLASVTGVDRKYGLDMVLLMHTAVLAGKAFYDLLDLIAFGFGGITLTGFACCLLCLAASCAAAYLAIRGLRSLAESKGFGSFAYYSWGMALFTFVFTLMA